MGGETQYISQHNTLYPHCGMGGETQYISQHNTLDPHCGMGGRHNIFPNTIHWIHIVEWEGDTIYFPIQYIGSILRNFHNLLISRMTRHPAPRTLLPWVPH